MNDSVQPPASPIDAGVAKAIALGLGLLLILGTALMIVLLLTQKSEPDSTDIAPIELQAGEKVTAVTSIDGQALFLIEDPNGAQRVLLVNLTTDARSEVQIFAPNSGVTD